MWYSLNYSLKGIRPLIVYKMVDGPVTVKCICIHTASKHVTRWTITTLHWVGNGFQLLNVANKMMLQESQDHYVLWPVATNCEIDYPWFLHTLISPFLDPVMSRRPEASIAMAVISLFPWQSPNCTTISPVSISHTLTSDPSPPTTTCNHGNCSDLIAGNIPDGNMMRRGRYKEDVSEL